MSEGSVGGAYELRDEMGNRIEWKTVWLDCIPWKLAGSIRKLIIY